MRFKYIGLKVDGERAFEKETGIVWMPGAEHEVAHVAAAAQMLQHATVWQALGDTPQSVAGWKREVRPMNIGAIDDEVMFDEFEEQEARKLAEAAKALQAQAAQTEQAVAAPGGEPAATETADPIASLDDAGVRAFAKERGLKVHGIGLMKGDNLRAKVREALGA